MAKFLDELGKALENGKKKQRYDPATGKTTVLPDVTLSDKIIGLKGAIERAKISGAFNKDTYVSSFEGTQRIVCCSTCTPSRSCPYCGCAIGAKRVLKTENCPTPETYPHLKLFPPRVYWDVCKQKTTVICIATTQNINGLSDTIKSLIENATGEIEIFVGLNGINKEIELEPSVKIAKSDEVIGYKRFANRLSRLSTGDYFFFITPGAQVDLGWDTKLKCLTIPEVITCPSIMVRGTDKKISCFKVNNDLEESVWEDFKLHNNFPAVEQSMTFCPSAWMIEKSTFFRNGSFDLTLGEDGNESLEWALKLWLTNGHIFVRFDTICTVESVDFKSVPEITKQIKNRWCGQEKIPGQTLTLKELVDKFTLRYGEIPGWVY